MAGRLGTVRARATLVAAVVVGAAMAVGALGLLSLLRASMTEGVETTATAQLNDVAALVRLGQLPAELPAGRGDTFTQVVDASGKVFATSAPLLGTKLITSLRRGEDGTIIHTIPALSDLGAEKPSDPEGPYLLLAQTVTAPPLAGGAGRPLTVYVAGSLQPVERATAIVGLALAGGLPVLVILVAALVWVFGGRALRPVELIRSEVADISGHDLHRRVPVPASTDEVARLARTMNEMLDRLESAAATQRQFLADASHELRSPLAALQTTLEVALVHPNPPAWPAVAADALDEARRIQRLVEDLLALARTDEVLLPLRAEPVDLDEIVLFEGRRRRATSRVGLDLHGVSAGRVAGDADALSRVVSNLVDNAQRHAASQVVIELKTAGDQVVLTVADDGTGIAPTDRQRVFERFTRLDEARNQEEGGTGLGLAIVKQIVNLHGGSIEVADTAVGARLVVRLPALEVDVDEESEEVGAPSEGSNRPVGRGR